MTTDPLPLRGVPKAKVCKVCAALPPGEQPKGHPLKAPHEGPRCHRHNQLAKKASKAKRHERDSQQTYGMPPGFMARLLAFQGHACGCCGRRLVRPHRDHDHKIADPQRAFRGAVCRNCNSFLGYIRDDEAVLLRMLRYLRDPPAQQLLVAWSEEEGSG